MTHQHWLLESNNRPSWPFDRPAFTTKDARGQPKKWHFRPIKFVEWIVFEAKHFPIIFITLFIYTSSIHRLYVDCRIVLHMLYSHCCPLSVHDVVDSHSCVKWMSAFNQFQCWVDYNLLITWNTRTDTCKQVVNKKKTLLFYDKVDTLTANSNWQLSNRLRNIAAFELTETHPSTVTVFFTATISRTY